MKIKILKRVRLHEDLKVYKEVKDSTLKEYKPDDIVLDVNDLYFERYSIYPKHIEILEAPKKGDEDEVYVNGLKKKDVETHLQEMGIEFDPKEKVETLKSQLLSSIKANKENDNGSN